VQISDTHIGFNKPANPDAAGTLALALQKIAQSPIKLDFLIHTGDITQLSKEKEFDDAAQILAATKLDKHFTPGEHDVLDETPGASFLARHGKGTLGKGWHSFDHKGVHFVCLVNVFDLKPGGMGSLGPEQLAWLAQDLTGKSASTPIVLFAHMPLWTISREWGWGTQDGDEALKLLARFGSATVLNGHVHQIIQKVEGHLVLHTARSTAFPQPAPGEGPAPGPKLTPAERLRETIGLTTVTVASGPGPLALVDGTLT